MQAERYTYTPYRHFIYSPVHDATFILNLRSASQITIQFDGDGGKSTGTIDLAGFFATEVQPNLDRCGQTQTARTPVGDTGGERVVRFQYSVASDIDKSQLSTIVTAHNVANYDFAEQLHLICDTGRLDVIVTPRSIPSISNGIPTLYITIDGGETDSVRWPYIRTLKSGFSPDDDRAFLERLRQATTITVQVGTERAAELHIAGLMQTPAQENIDYCGQY